MRKMKSKVTVYWIYKYFQIDTQIGLCLPHKVEKHDYQPPSLLLDFFLRNEKCNYKNVMQVIYNFKRGIMDHINSPNCVPKNPFKMKFCRPCCSSVLRSSQEWSILKTLSHPAVNRSGELCFTQCFHPSVFHNPK